MLGITIGGPSTTGVTATASTLNSVRTGPTEALRRTVVALRWTTATVLRAVGLTVPIHHPIAIGVVAGVLAGDVVVDLIDGAAICLELARSRSVGVGVDGSVGVLAASDQSRGTATTGGEGHAENGPTVNRPCWHGFPLSRTQAAPSIPFDSTRGSAESHSASHGPPLRSPPERWTYGISIGQSTGITRAIPAEGTADLSSFIPTRCRDCSFGIDYPDWQARSSRNCRCRVR